MKGRSTHKVLLVEDSATVAAYLVSLLVAESDMQVLPVARTAEDGVRVALSERPDVVLMDIQLPDHDGLWAIEQIMADRPCPIVVLSGYLSVRERNITFESLRAGAVDVLAKPTGLQPAVRDAFRESLLRTVRLMASAVVVRRNRRAAKTALPAPAQTSQVVTQANLSRIRRVLVGASTGGPELLYRMLSELPAPLPFPTLITQHTLDGFDESLAQWLCGTGHTVRIAREGEFPLPGCVLLAPATRSMRVSPHGLGLVPISQAGVSSVDTMFESAASSWGADSMAVLLTGMGRDGSQGMAALHDAGAFTVAQSADSCVVASMPDSARARGVVRQSLSPSDIIELLRQLARVQSVGASPVDPGQREELNMAKKTIQASDVEVVSWELLGEPTLRSLSSALELLPAEQGLPAQAMALQAAQRSELCQKREAYFASVLAREPVSVRLERLTELDRTARGMSLSGPVSAALVHERVLALGGTLLLRARAKADCIEHWRTLAALESLVRADLASAEEQARDHMFEEFAQEVGENVQGTSSTLFVLTQAREPLEAAASVLEAVRAAFTWEFASYWTVSPGSDTLALSFTSGELPERLVRALHEARPRSGEGHLGRALARADVVVTTLEQEPAGSVLRQEFERAGARTLIALPLSVAGRVVGVMGFAVRRVLDVSEPRRDALRQVASQVSTTLERMTQVTEMRDIAGAAEAVNRVLRRINLAVTGADAVSGALEAVREAFDWEYGAVWTRARHGNELIFEGESGDVGLEFRRATKLARYGRGVGVVGRAFQARDLIVVDDLGALPDDLRAGAARDTGIRSGVCFPLIVRDEVVGVIEVWSTRAIKLSSLRLDALRSVSSAVSGSLERLDERDAFATSLRDFAGELMEVSRALRSTTAEQSASAQELASAIGEVTATLSELRETSSEALRNAELVISKAEGAFQTSASGRESVVHAIASMRAIREQVSEIAERILQLNDQTSQIGNIISTVNEISAQSKLLALNAAIEAARAGEHGKGFGVVASEIRSLAEQSKEATNQVREILGEIQGGTNAAVVAAEEGTKKSESGMALADVSGEKIQELARSMEESSSSARLIANSARQQSAGIEQVAQALVAISNATNTTAAGLKQTELATSQLVGLAERMAGIVRAMVDSGGLPAGRADNQNAAE